jgi:hypothetical protein
MHFTHERSHTTPASPEGIAMDSRTYNIFGTGHPCLCGPGADFGIKPMRFDLKSSGMNPSAGVMYKMQGGYSQRPTSRGSRRQESSNFNLSTGMTYVKRQEPKRKRPIWPWILFSLVIILLLANALPRDNAIPVSAPTNSLAVDTPPTNIVPTPSKALITQSPITPSPKAATPTPVSASTATPVTVLGRGVKNDEVEALQEKLIELGYLKEGQADGVFGRDTEKAVEAFQQKNGLEADGVAGEKTLTLINSGNAKKK